MTHAAHPDPCECGHPIHYHDLPVPCPEHGDPCPHTNDGRCRVCPCTAYLAAEHPTQAPRSRIVNHPAHPGIPDALCPACSGLALTDPTTYLCPACGQDNAPDGPGCRCYGAPLPPYWPGIRPNADELAAFRYRIMPDAYDCEAFDHPAARDWERTGGIPGWRQAGSAAAHCRREASAMRSRAYLRQPCGNVAHVPTDPGIAPVTCERHADHDGSHCARLPGVWQWWNRDGAPPPVEIPKAAYVNGGRPLDWIDPRQTR